MHNILGVMIMRGKTRRITAATARASWRGVVVNERTCVRFLFSYGYTNKEKISFYREFDDINSLPYSS
jgi:hypothetical protein